MEIGRFLSPYPYYSDPRAAPSFEAANPWKNYSGNATYQASNPYVYGNTGYRACYTGYQQQFNQRIPLYSSNFSPHHPWQAASTQSTPYLYQPSNFTSSNFQRAGMVPQDADATNFYYFSSNILILAELSVILIQLVIQVMKRFQWLSTIAPLFIQINY